MVKKMLGLNPGKSGKLDPCSPELDKVSAAIRRDAVESTSVELRGHRNVCGVVDPNQKWMLVVNYAERGEYQAIGWRDKTVAHVENPSETELFESQAAARDAAESQIDAYADAEYRNAVECRTGRSNTAPA